MINSNWKIALQLLLATCCSARAADTFDPTSNQLVIPSLQIGQTVFSNVVVRLGAYSVVSAGPASTLQTSNQPACTSATFTQAVYDQISLGMTLDQVRQILACQSELDVDAFVTSIEATGYGTLSWGWPQVGLGQPTNESISVVFDRNYFVSMQSPTIPFKSRVGF